METAYGGKDTTVNYTIYLMNQTLLITSIHNYKRLAWAGHMVRMNNGRIIQKIFNTKPERVGGAGRPRPRWEDMKTLGVKKWKNAALGGDDWTQLLKKAKQMMMMMMTTTTMVYRRLEETSEAL